MTLRSDVPIGLCVKLGLAFFWLAGCNPRPAAEPTPSAPPPPSTDHLAPTASSGPMASSVPTANSVPTAIGSYEPSVKAGNQSRFDRIVRLRFAMYLNLLHRGLHVVFADEVLPSLDALGPDDPQNQSALVTSIEMVLASADGRLVRSGVTQSSGVPDFDDSVMAAVKRSAPFAVAPEAIASPDGNVYVHWDFHRDPVKACSTHGARPYKLQHHPSGSGP